MSNRLDIRDIIRAILRKMLEDARISIEFTHIATRYHVYLSAEDYAYNAQFINTIKRDALTALDNQYKELTNLSRKSPQKPAPKVEAIPPLPQPKSVPQKDLKAKAKGWLKGAGEWFKMPEPQALPPFIEVPKPQKDDIYARDLYKKLENTKPNRGNQPFMVEVHQGADVASGNAIIDTIWPDGVTNRSTILIGGNQEIGRVHTPPVAQMSGASPTVIVPSGSFTPAVPASPSGPFAEIRLESKPEEAIYMDYSPMTFGRKNATTPADVDLGVTQNVSGIHFQLRYNSTINSLEIKDMSHDQLGTWEGDIRIGKSLDATKGDLDLWHPLPSIAEISVGYHQGEVKLAIKTLIRK